MDDETIVNTDTQNGEEEIVLDLEEDDKGDEPNIEELKEQNKKLFARAKKAEGFELKDGKWIKPERVVEKKPEVKKEPSFELSAKDALLLAKADVDLDDVDEVVDFAKYRKITVAEAIKSPLLKSIIDERKEERKTANATLMNNTRKTSTPTNEAIIEKAQRGELKEDDIDRLVQARMDAKLKK